jgi:integrase
MKTSINLLHAATLKKAKPREKLYKLSDGGGLFFVVTPSGSKRWQFNYTRPGGSLRNSVGLGAYPEVSLESARRTRTELRTQLAEGVDPSERKKAQREAQNHRFQGVAEQWLARRRTAWTERHLIKVRRRLELYVYPHLGRDPIEEITPQRMLRVIGAIEAQGKYDTAHRVRNYCSGVFRYGVAAGICLSDPTRDIGEGLHVRPKAKHHPGITDPVALGELLRVLHGYSGSPVVAHALKLAPLVFVRPGELRRAEWTEISFQTASWRIPAEKMKMDREHVVPLSRQAIEILENLREITGHQQFVFPSSQGRERPMSENTINVALRRLGYDSNMQTGHGFRTTASTLLNELGFHPDHIEKQLAHIEGNAVRDAYNRASYLVERAKMMQVWADYLDRLREGQSANVLAFRRAV